jgi:hypothetical protein
MRGISRHVGHISVGFLWPAPRWRLADASSVTLLNAVASDPVADCLSCRSMRQWCD